jgi:hypothetical protein
MSIRGYVTELEEINSELKRLRVVVRKLNIRKKEVESSIVEYLADKDTPGVKYKDSTIRVKNTMKRPILKKSESLDNTRKLLESYGIKDPDSFIAELNDAKKGEAVEKNTILIKKMKS